MKFNFWPFKKRETWQESFHRRIDEYLNSDEGKVSQLKYLGMLRQINKVKK